ncbi:MAG TPA: glycoside hydrolase family 38 C-terminal domain-containing protein, partial [Clostridia bacterium]
AAYPAEAIQAGWEVVLRNQFHDILPGSSIKEVYDDSKEEYEQTLAQSDALISQSLQAIAGRVSAGAGSGPGRLVVFNPNGFGADGHVVFDAPSGITRPVLEAGGAHFVCQLLADGRWLAIVPEIPSKGYRSFQLEEETRQTAPQSPGEDLVLSPGHLANAFLDLRLDEKGQFISIYDKRAGRELLPAGTSANVIMSYEDKPHNYDAWDLNQYYREKSWEIDDVQSIRVTESGPVRGCLQIRRKYLDSTILQSITIWRDHARIDIRNEIDWHEKQVFLKALFPVDIHSSQATFDIQYGNVQRATHSNTSWDVARFEVCMHKWMDVSEEDYGFSLLNDSKYGCSVQAGVIGLSMLKSAVYPNPEADKEKHDFVFSLYPHTGGWRQAGTVQQAYLLNNPLMAVICGATASESGKQALARTCSLVQADQDNIVIEAVKQAEDSQDLIIRFYECYNRRTPVRLTFARPIGHVSECDLMEQDLAVLETVAADGASRNAIDLEIRPYEIRTIKVRFS